MSAEVSGAWAPIPQPRTDPYLEALRLDRSRVCQLLEQSTNPKRITMLRKALREVEGRMRVAVRKKAK